jgi:hypothetical protein
LLLTLLAVPVFYSLFDDAQESTIWKKASDRYEEFKENNLRPAYQRFAGAISGIFSRKKLATERDLPNKSKDAYADQTSGD